MISASQCEAAGASPPLGTEHAWQLAAASAIACVDEGPNAWSNHITAVDLYFPSPVSEQAAVAAAAAVMPADVLQGGSFEGVNNNQSAIPAGSCRQIVYTSQTLRALVPKLNSTWTGDPAKASVTLYSGKATAANGADQAYDPARIHLASVGIGGENRGADGVVHC